MTLHANRARSITSLLLVCLLGFSYARRLLFCSCGEKYGSPFYIYLIAAMGMVSVFGIVFSLVYILKINKTIILENNTLTAPCKKTVFALPRTVTTNIADINLSKSSVSFFGGANLLTNKGSRIIISPWLYSSTTAKKLFDEIERLQSTQND